MPFQGWLTELPLPLKVRTVLLALFWMVKVHVPGLLALMVAENVVLSCTPALLLGDRNELEATRLLEVGVPLSTVTLAVLETPGLPAWSLKVRVAV